MGGMGSGRRPSFPTTLDDFHTIETAYLRRHDLLRPWTWTSLRSSRAGRETGSIGLGCSGDALFLSYRVTSWRGTEAEDVEERVPLVRTAQPFGGERLWFACPGCGRRCAVLHGGRRVRCRLCVAGPHARPHEGAPERPPRPPPTPRRRPGGGLDRGLGPPVP